MAASRTLKLTYLGDASNLSKSTGKAGDDVSKLGERVGKVGKAIGVAFLAVGAAGLAMGKKLFDAFEEVTTANARIEAVVTSMGNFAGEVDGVTKRLVEQAEATAKLTGVDRNLIKESQALLLTFDSVNKTAGDAGSVFDRATQAAVDLAAAGFGSVTGNAQQLGKALEDPIKGLSALSRSGVTFTEEQKALIASLVESNQTLAAQGIILSAIETQVGGVAEATASGSAKIRQAFGILTEQVATALAPAFERLVEFGLLFVDRVASWWDANGEGIIESFGRFAGRVKESWEEFQTFFSIVGEELKARGTFDRLTEKFAEVRESAAGAGESINRLLDSIVGPGPEARGGAFAMLIDTYYVKPLEFFLDRADRFFQFVDRVAAAGARVGEFFQGRGQLGIGQDPNFDMGGFTPGQVSPAGRKFIQPNPQIVVNVTGAMDPEGTARTIQRTLNDSRLRVGNAPVPGLASIN